jgi:hypothetical protein
VKVSPSRIAQLGQKKTLIWNATHCIDEFFAAMPAHNQSVPLRSPVFFKVVD